MSTYYEVCLDGMPYYVAGEWRHEGVPAAECEPARIVSITGSTVEFDAAYNVTTLTPEVWVDGRKPRNRAERRRAAR